MTPTPWRQTTLAFADPNTADDIALTHLAPILADAETHRLITAWFFVRKGAWRLRYRPAITNPETTSPKADAYMTDRLTRLHRAGYLTAVIPGSYEPETHAFGGTAAMAAAHRLWHHDSRHLLNPTAGEPARRREWSIMLCAAMMRAAGLDHYEQGDVWARVADHRDPPRPALVDTLLNPVQRLLTVDPASLTCDGAQLSAARPWIAAHTAAGATLGRLNQTGQLRRGLRAVLAHHVIFAWNRRGIPAAHQAAIATAARTTIFGPEPTEVAATAARAT